MKRIVLEDGFRKIFAFIDGDGFVYGTYIMYKTTKQGYRLSDGIHKWVLLGKLNNLEKEYDVKELKFDQ